MTTYTVEEKYMYTTIENTLFSAIDFRTDSEQFGALISNITSFFSNQLSFFEIYLNAVMCLF